MDRVACAHAIFPPQLTDLDEAQARAASLQMDLIVLRRQLEAREAAVGELQQREADLRSTVASLNSENAQQQQLLQRHKEQLLQQQQLLSTLQRDATNAAALQSTIDQLRAAVLQGEESLRLLQARASAAESDAESAHAQLVAAEERVASLKLAVKVQADAAAAAAAAAASAAVANTRTEMTQEIEFMKKLHADQLQQQRDDSEEELRLLRDQLRLFQDSIVVLNQELGAATAALHTQQQQQQQAPSSLPSSSSDSAVDRANAATRDDSSALADLRARLTAKDREFRAVKGALTACMRACVCKLLCVSTFVTLLLHACGASTVRLTTHADELVAAGAAALDATGTRTTAPCLLHRTPSPTPTRACSRPSRRQEAVQCCAG